MNSLISEASAFNYEMFKKIHQSGDQKAIQNAQTNFGITSTSPFWQYNK